MRFLGACGRPRPPQRVARRCACALAPAGGSASGSLRGAAGVARRCACALAPAGVSVSGSLRESAAAECGPASSALPRPHPLGREGRPYCPLPCLFISSRPLACCFTYLCLQYFLKHCVLMVVDLGKPWEAARDKGARRAAAPGLAKSRRLSFEP